MMCGFFFGVFGAYFLFRMMRWRGRCGPGGWHGPRRSRRRGWLDWMFTRLDTTHGQEKVIQEAASEIEEAVRSAKGLGRKHKRDLADILRGDEFDHEAVGEAWSEQDEALEKVRMSIVSSLQKVHEVLERRQRDQLADMLDAR